MKTYVAISHHYMGDGDEFILYGVASTVEKAIRLIEQDIAQERCCGVLKDVDYTEDTKQWLPDYAYYGLCYQKLITWIYCKHDEYYIRYEIYEQEMEDS